MRISWLIFLLSLSSLVIGQRYIFLNAFSPVRYYSEDFGVSFEIDRHTAGKNSYDVGGYYSAQTSALGAGIWFHASAFTNVEVHPDFNDLNFSVGGNCGITFLLFEAKLKRNFKQRTTSFVPGVGLGLNRLIYAIVDFYTGRLYSSNRIGGHLVIRIPLFSSQDYKSGIPPEPYE